ncbi:MAG: SDR family oxidoreductase [Acidobacteriaceae bacterium]|nr:SDR family oxidoreductase [Acidobacteriaceae bacterium]
MTPSKHSAVILLTGASSGIGAALAVALAPKGAHLLLTARSADRLAELAQQVRSAGGHATVLPLDLAAPGAARQLFDEVQSLGISIDTLINCAGFGLFGPLAGNDPARLSQMLQLNVVALTELTRLFLPELLARRGTVLNIASTAAFQPTPYMAAYGATKAYVLSFSEALWAEYRSRGLRVAAVCPGPVETPFLDAMGPAVRSTPLFRAPLTVAQVVQACLRALDAPGPTHIVGLRNWLMAQSARFAPRGLAARLGAILLAPPAP